MRGCCWSLVCALGVLGGWAGEASALNQHKVEILRIVGPDRVVVRLAEFPVTVRLAYCRVPASLANEAQAELEKFLRGGDIQMSPAVELDLDEQGCPQVYLIRRFTTANELLIRNGYTSYNGDSKQYKRTFREAVETAKHARKGVWAPAAAPPVQVAKEAEDATGRYVADLYSGLYHQPTCRHAARISGGRQVYYVSEESAQKAGKKPCPVCMPAPAEPVGEAEATGAFLADLHSSQYHQSTCRQAARIKGGSSVAYRSADEAEKAGKKPCWICLTQRAEQLTFGGGARTTGGVAALIESEGKFHAPTCPLIQGKKGGRHFRSLAEAQASGLEPCEACLMLGPQVPAQFRPTGNQCVGRAPPYYRPCQGTATDETGLCPHCQGRD